MTPETVLIPEIIPPEKDPETVAVQGEASALIRQSDIAVNDEASFSSAGELLVKIAKTTKELEARRKAIVGPANGFVKSVNDFFRLTTKPLDDASRAVKSRIATYQRHQAEEAEKKRRAAEEADRRRREAEAKAEAAKAAESAQDGAEPEADPLAAFEAEAAAETAAEAQAAVSTVAVPEKTTRMDGGGAITFRKVPKWELVDIAAVPRDWLVLNEKAVNAAVRGGVLSIPGIRIWQEDEVVTRTR